MLSDALGGNSRTCLILACSPALFNTAETLSTLRFGKRAKEIRNNVSINEELSVAEYKKRLNAANRIINQMKAENKLLGHKIESLRSTMDDKHVKDPTAQEIIEQIEKKYPIAGLLRSMAASAVKLSNIDNSSAKNSNTTKEKKSGKTGKNAREGKKRGGESKDGTNVTGESSKKKSKMANRNEETKTRKKQTKAKAGSTKTTKNLNISTVDEHNIESKEMEPVSLNSPTPSVGSSCAFETCMFSFCFFCFSYSLYLACLFAFLSGQLYR